MLENRMQAQQVQKHMLTPELIKSFQLYDLPFQELGYFVRQMTAENLFLEFDYSLLEDSFGLLTEDHSGEWESNTAARDPRDRMVCQDPCNSLQHELRLQVLLSNASDTEQQAALYLIESLDTRGYFTEPIEQFAKQYGLSTEDATKGLALVQRLQPIGIGARNLKECLKIQARESVDYPLICQILQDESGRLERLDMNYFAKLCCVNRAKIEQIFAYLATLHPFPGDIYCESDIPRYIFPDIYIQRYDGHLKITLPHGDRLLRLDAGYYHELRQISQKDKPSQAFIRKQYDEAREWMHILKIRQTTLTRFAHCLAEAQFEYFFHGPGHMRPLNLSHIAEQMNMHPSTVCRLSKDKYIQTDWGMVQASTLFSGAFYTEDGMIATDTVKNLLCMLIRQEDRVHPASDRQLADAVMQKLQIQISRRTIAKYRAELGIACQRERKISKFEKEVKK